MIKATCQKLRHGVAAVALTVVGLCHPAYAAEFIVNWDPLFNPAFRMPLVAEPATWS